MTSQGAGSAGVNGILTADQVAQFVVDTMKIEAFLCLPHPKVASYMRSKTANYARWLSGMQKMYVRYLNEALPSAPKD